MRAGSYGVAGRISTDHLRKGTVYGFRGSLDSLYGGVLTDGTRQLFNYNDKEERRKGATLAGAIRYVERLWFNISNQRPFTKTEAGGCE